MVGQEPLVQHYL